MRIAIAADERAGVADAVVEEVRRRGHEPLLHGALSDAERDDWAWASEAAVLEEILDSWFAGSPSTDEDDRANVAHLDEI